MEEATSNLLIEVLKIYGLPGVILLLLFITVVVLTYKLGPNILNRWEQQKMGMHDKQMQNSIKRGPKIQKILRDNFGGTHCDHLFVGEFHNGSTDVTGIPYMKFDIIYEHVGPEYHGNDIFLNRLYENEHILTHDQLPDLLFRNYSLCYNINELKDIDEHLYLRMKSRDMKSIALCLICDINYKPIAFIGGVSFSDKKINITELNKCANDIEKIYRE